MSMEQWWNDTDRGNPEVSRKGNFVYNQTITNYYFSLILSHNLTAIVTVLPSTN